MTMPTSHVLRSGLRVTFLVLLASSLLTMPVSAQDRSSTGRHQPEPKVVEEATEEGKPVATTRGLERRWHFGLDGGVQGGGDLFRIETADGGSIGWEMGNGKYFNASRFTATLDQDFVLNLHAIRDLNAIWSVRGDVNWSNMDVAAEALSGQIGVLYQFDRFSVINLGLGMEARLVKVASHPFINFQVLVSNLSPETNTELEQTNFGGRLGLGYNQVVSPEVSLRLEVRYSLTAFSVGDYVPSSILPTDPEVIYDPQDNLDFFEILLGIQGNF
jgi:hypothetical protein